MKCVCPMGGDRTCPDNCFLAAWHRLPDDQKTPARRRPIVEQLHKQGYTQEAIAMQLGVSQNTISKDLETLSNIDNVKDRGKDTLGRKKSTGRPKGNKASAKDRRLNTSDAAKAAAQTIVDGDKTYPEVERETGFSNTVLRAAVAHEEGRREERAQVNPIRLKDYLSLTAQQKLDTAIRVALQKLEREFAERSRLEAVRIVDEMMLPHYLQSIKETYDKVVELRFKGITTKTKYRKLQACLHPDWCTDPKQKARYEEAFHILKEMELVLLSEADSPTQKSDLPKSYADLMARKAQAAAARKRKPANGAVVSQ